MEKTVFFFFLSRSEVLNYQCPEPVNPLLFPDCSVSRSYLTSHFEMPLASAKTVYRYGPGMAWWKALINWVTSQEAPVAVIMERVHL